MMMLADTTTRTAIITLDRAASEESPVELDHSVWAFVTPDGSLSAVELLDTDAFTDGAEFSDAHAEHVVEWVRQQLAGHPAA